MKNNYYFILVSLLILLTSTSIFAQRNKKRYVANAERFNAGLVIGFNNSQLDGDRFAGYDKIGLTGGIKGIVRLLPRLDFNMELLYSKKGSNIFPDIIKRVNPSKDRVIDLTYMDVPLSFKWLLDDGGSAWHVEGGIVYSRMINNKIIELIEDRERQFSYQGIVDQFKKDDLATLVGGGYTWRNGLSVHGRFVFGLTQFYTNENIVEPAAFLPVVQPIEFLRNYFVSFQVAYAIF